MERKGSNVAWVSKKTLRPYQVEDVADLVLGRRMILASDTGVGKTLTYLRTAEQLFEDQKITKMFIFTPASTRIQVRDSIKAETDSDVLVISGTKAQRIKLFKKARRASVKYVIFGMSQTVSTEEERITALLDHCYEQGSLGIIVDEAYYLKDGLARDWRGYAVASQRTQSLFRLRTYFKYRYLVTATPVQNSPSDVYWLMYFMFGPKVFGPKIEFDAKFVVKNQWGVPIGCRKLAEFNDVLSPYMIRRSVEDPDVKKYMPKLVTENVIVTIESRNFKKCYKLLRKSVIMALNTLGSIPQDTPDPKQIAKREAALRAAQTRYAYLKMLCVGGTALLLKRQTTIKAKGKKSILHKLVRENPDLFTRPNWGPKIEALPETVNTLLRENPKHKIVIFCYFRDALDHIAEVLEKSAKDHRIVVCKGGDNDQKKKHLFNFDPKTRIFITSDANREGVDLPGGSHLFQLDMPHNFALYWQRVTRIRRTGSKHKTVFGFNIIVEGTIEERQLEHIERTRDMSKAIVDGKPYKADLILGTAKKGALLKARRGLLLNSSTLSGFLKGDTFGDDIRS
jgi:SNF2 family DNA or RNA helicase